MVSLHLVAVYLVGLFALQLASSAPSSSVTGNATAADRAVLASVCGKWYRSVHCGKRVPHFDAFERFSLRSEKDDWRYRLMLNEVNGEYTITIENYGKIGNDLILIHTSRTTFSAGQEVEMAEETSGDIIKTFYRVFFQQDGITLTEEISHNFEFENSNLTWTFKADEAKYLMKKVTYERYCSYKPE